MDAAPPIVHHPAYEVDIGPHVFPTAKYRLVRARLVDEGTLDPAAIVEPTPIHDDDVRLVHTPTYVKKIRAGLLSIPEQLVLEVPFSPALRDAMWLCAGGTTLTGRLALEAGIAVHLGGGYHHAFPDHGEGFCLINDVAIAIRCLQRNHAVKRAMVVDCDVHHGNGTAAIFRSDATVFTFSMHQERNYPATKPTSDLDLGLDDGVEDATYLELLAHHLPEILARHHPDIAFYLAGADPYREDQLGGLGLTMQGLARRDDVVFATLREAGVAVAVTLAGGYARQQEDTVEIHCNTVRAAVAARGA
ncbi:MAG: histone deacetylase [Gemmatimonadota bacterium]|nr:histone deacetylase [Gemmatimonadota bacterium]MDH3368944.1 histone deacetylase [Gemmatimonadota bacterium]MDH3478238.1 histone deacetylase [Gemmatimonadota bacterium]MDH3571928.1 histone deacetylase [Gemmatimonadota bacterium]MDH5550624.1 histone deacetylase [Gemmatimonadota bacterium]